MYRNDLVDVRASPSMPPKDHAEYVYETTSAGTIPPVGPSMLMHLLEHPDHAEVVPVLYKRIPKKLYTKLEACPLRGSSMGWGMQFVEGMDRFVVFVLGCVGFAACLVVAVVWSAARQDIQGGFAIAGFLLAFMAFCGGICHSEFVL